MTTLDHQHRTLAQYCASVSLAPSTAWIPLDGLAAQWGHFGAEATTARALQATSRVFAALAQETSARQTFLIAWRTSQDVDVTDLGHVLDELVQARQSWTDALLSLEFVVMEARGTQISPETVRLLMIEAMEQRMRLSMLLQEVEREHLLVYRGVPASHEREEGMRR